MASAVSHQVFARAFPEMSRARTHSRAVHRAW